MIGEEDSPNTYEYPEHYKILTRINNWEDDPKRIKNGVKVPGDFVYRSDTNPSWMSGADLKAWIDLNAKNIGKI